MAFWRRLFGAARPPRERTSLDLGQRMAILAQYLGPPENQDYHAPIPLFLGGFADVAVFRFYVPGYAYVTTDVIQAGPKPNRLGACELMICTRDAAEWAPNLISRLARYLFDAVVQPGETMDIGPALPTGSRLDALVFCELDPPVTLTRDYGEKSGILLAVGISAVELAVARSTGTAKLLHVLKDTGVFPFTELQRSSVL